MSYENPQVVVNTESAKYYAAAISGIGQSVAKAIQQGGDRKRAEAKARKKQNLLDANNRVKFGSEYLTLVNKSLKDFDMSSEISPQLNELIDKAADVKTRLMNMTSGSSEYFELKDELNALETFFNVGLEQGLENFVGIRSDFSQGQNSIGSEQSYDGDELINFGLSASQTQPSIVRDVLSLLPNTKPIKRSFSIKRLKGEDGKMGAYNIFAAFGKKFENFTGEEVADFRNIPQRTYNINKDFGTESVVTNPNISKVVTNTLNDLEITKDGSLNYKGKIPSSGLLSIMTKETEIVDRGGMKLEIPKISVEALRAKLSGALQARIGGIVKSGDAETGSLGIGINRMQSYVDDILPEKLDDFVGTLEPDPSTAYGLTEESYKRLEYAIAMVKKREIEGGLVGKEVEGPEKLSEGDIKRGEKTTMLSSLGKDLLTFDTLRPGRESGIRMDIIPDEKFQQELLTIGPGFTYSKIISDGGKDFIPLKVVGAPDSDAVQIPLAGLSDVALKKAMYLLAGGKKSDPIYKELGEDKKEVKDPYDVFAR
jgi:hypothetical protein